MKKIEVKNILDCDFSAYGRYVNLLDSQLPYIGEEPIRFYRDMMPLGGNETLSLSVTIVEPMKKIIEEMEFHSKTGECFLSLDGDTYICVGVATEKPELRTEELKAFFVPMGTAIYIHPGVWHYAPYPVGEKTIHSLVILPQRTYANDCIKVKLEKDKMLEMDI
ncbi:MAG: DUF4867 family protein [Lachnospiraceae bacterium]